VAEHLHPVAAGNFAVAALQEGAGVVRSTGW
jgi:hypothetical protein